MQQQGVTARVESREGRQWISVEGGSTSHRVYVGGAPEPDEAGEPAAALGLAAAMGTGATLEVAQPVSPRLRSGLEQLQRAFTGWDSGLRRVGLELSLREEAPASPAQGVAAFFSGGVDSFYTLLEHPAEITHLILVHGFDFRLGEVELRLAVSGMAGRVAKRFGVELIEIETDLRGAIDPYLGWPMGHGIGLATVGLCLQRSLRRILVPASYTYSSMFPWGTHPLIDPLWSTESTEFVHDGFGVDRLEKIERIGRSDIALQSLRVCWENRDGAYNCGRCEKCVRTMISLAAIGALDRCPTFARPLTPSAVASLPLVTTGVRAFAEQNLAVLRARGKSPEIERALEKAMARSSGLRGAGRRLRSRAGGAWRRMRR